MSSTNSPQKLLVVTGATGSQGKAVLEFFQKHEPSFKLRGLTRNPSSPSALAISATLGVEMVPASYDDPASLAAAFSGATHIFAYTDFGGILASDEVMGRFQRGEISAPLGPHAFDVEVRHGKNLADAAAKVSGLERLVWSTLSRVKEWSGGKYVVPHFDAKGVVWDHMMALEGLRGKVSSVLMGMFYSNPVKMGVQFGFGKQPDGNLSWTSIFPSDDDEPWVDVENDTGAFVKALIDAPAGTQLMGVSENRSVRGWTELFTQTTGAKMVYNEISSEDYVQDDPIGFKDTMSQLIKFLHEYGYDGKKEEILTPDELEKKLGSAIPRTSLAKNIKETDWAKVEWTGGLTSPSRGR